MDIFKKILNSLSTVEELKKEGIMVCMRKDMNKIKTIINGTPKIRSYGIHSSFDKFLDSRTGSEDDK